MVWLFFFFCMIWQFCTLSQSFRKLVWSPQTNYCLSDFYWWHGPKRDAVDCGWKSVVGLCRLCVLSNFDSDGSHQEPKIRKRCLQKSSTSQVRRGSGPWVKRTFFWSGSFLCKIHSTSCHNWRGLCVGFFQGKLCSMIKPENHSMVKQLVTKAELR